MNLRKWAVLARKKFLATQVKLLPHLALMVSLASVLIRTAEAVIERLRSRSETWWLQAWKPAKHAKMVSICMRASALHNAQLHLQAWGQANSNDVVSNHFSAATESFENSMEPHVM